MKKVLVTFLFLLAYGSASIARADQVEDFFKGPSRLYSSGKVEEAALKVRRVLDQRTDKKLKEIRLALEAIPPEPVSWEKATEPEKEKLIKGLLDGMFLQVVQLSNAGTSGPDPRPSTAEDSSERHYQDGMVYYRQGRWNDAYLEFQEASNWKIMGVFGQFIQHNHHWQALQMLGQTCQRLGRVREALQVYEECLGVYPDNPEVMKEIHRLKGLPVPTPAPSPTPIPKWGAPEGEGSEEVHELPVSLLKPDPPRRP